MAKKKEIQVVVHYPENREACEERIRTAVAEWYAQAVEAELEQAGLSTADKLETIDRLQQLLTR